MSGSVKWATSGRQRLRFSRHIPARGRVSRAENRIISHTSVDTVPPNNQETFNEHLENDFPPRASLRAGSDKAGSPIAL
jgi:hypothetical protein